MDTKLQAKSALVTGSTQGIGKAIARALAAEGVIVGINSRKDTSGATKLKEEIEAEGGKSFLAMGDVSTDAGADAVAAAVKSAVGTLDILVNNAGTYPFANWWDSKPSDWLDTYNHDVLSGLRMIQRFVPAMVQRRWGRVISISSASGERVPSNQLPIYATSKSAQTHMTKLLAVELTNTGVTANVIAPAPVVTEGVISAYTDMAKREGRSTEWKDVEAHFVDTTLNDPPIRRMATSEEVAALAVYLASPLSDPVTGASYLIDVGFSLTGFRRVPTPLSVLQKQ